MKHNKPPIATNPSLRLFLWCYFGEFGNICCVWWSQQYFTSCIKYRAAFSLLGNSLVAEDKHISTANIPSNTLSQLNTVSYSEGMSVVDCLLYYTLQLLPHYPLACSYCSCTSLLYLTILLIFVYVTIPYTRIKFSYLLGTTHTQDN